MESSHVGPFQYMGTYVSRLPSPETLRLDSCSFRVPPAAAHFEIPPLRCSLPLCSRSLVHPHYELVKQQCDSWILDVAQPPTAAGCRLLLDCVIPHFICRAIPTAPSVHRLVHVTKMVSWFIVADDEDDRPDALGADDAASAQHASSVMAILGYSESSPNLVETLHAEGFPNGDLPLPLIDSRVSRYASCSKTHRREGALTALTKLWAEMCSEMTPGLRDRFVGTMEDYLQAIKLQATFRKAHRLPHHEDAYLKIRRQASFLGPSFALLEYALGIELAEETYSNPLIQRLRALASDYVSLCNDLISCKMEIAVGDYFNMPSIVYSLSEDKGWSFQDCIDHVANMIKDLDAQCVSMLPLIQQSTSPSLQHKFVNTYISTLCHGVSSCLAWYYESARYHPSNSHEKS